LTTIIGNLERVGITNFNQTIHIYMF